MSDISDWIGLVEYGTIKKAKSDIAVRYTDGKDPLSDFTHAMFVDAEKELQVMGKYGTHRFMFHKKDGVDIQDLKEDIIGQWEEDKKNGLLPVWEKDITGEEAYKSFAPKDIVKTAEGWDDGKLTLWMYERVLYPRQIGAVNTPDGAIVFNPDLIHPS